MERPAAILNDVGGTLHDRLHTVCRHLPTDYEPCWASKRPGPPTCCKPCATGVCYGGRVNGGGHATSCQTYAGL